MKDSLVSINIVSDNNVLENPSSIPLLCYWDGIGDLKDFIFSDKEFTDILYKKILNTEKYSNSKISFFYFKESDNNENEKYIENNINIQDILKLNKIGNNYKFWEDYIKDIFSYLYKCSYKSDYVFLYDINEDINEIYFKLVEKNKDKISKDTILNYLRSELYEKKLNNENIEYILNKVKEILNNI